MKKIYADVVGWFEQNMPVAKPELHFANPWQLLVAVILSAQCTDKRVNMVTPALFEAYPTAEAMAAATFEQVLPYIKSVSYPNSKTQHLIDAARMLVSDFGGEVPDDVQLLQKLPGVGRKTANVIQSVAFGKSTMAVDTHVFRVSHRLGLVSKHADTPYKVEQELVKNIPVEDIPRAHHWLLLHGRYVCTSRKPHCTKCDLSAVCASAATLSSSDGGSGSQL